ncbi:MAG TPA: SIS domain-containing protein [Verrucomicrobiae bacterium]|jgi:D-sedoheptulose 7-phosphate isomerase
MNIHIKNLLQRCPQLADCLPDIEAAFAIMCGCFRSGGKLLLCGNGGSAADAEHWAGELLKGFVHKRPLNEAEKKGLPVELGAKLQGALPAIPLTGFVSLNTAFANDVDPELTFAQLVWGLGRPGDILVGLSTSGNARNVCAAMEAAKAHGLHRIGLSGRTGGKLKSCCDLCITVPADETYLIQELHLPIYHCLCTMLEDEFFDVGKNPVAVP